MAYMIMDRDVLSAIFNRYKSGELKTRHFTPAFQRVFRWLIIFYSKHKKPPKRTIKNLYDKYKKNLNRETKEIIEDYLDRLSDEYVKFQEENIDFDFINSEIIPDFIREREIADRIEKAQLNLDRGEFEEAEKIISTYSSVSSEVEDQELGTIIPYTKKDVKKNMSDKISSRQIIYKFDGDLGNLIGPLQRGWLVAITGIEKAGKSFLLQEMGYTGALYQKQKVLYINLELPPSLARSRSWRRLSTTGNKKVLKHIYPVLDCENNQNGTCKKRKRPLNKTSLFRSKDEIVYWKDRRNWKICQKCRFENIRKNAARTKRFIPTIWFDRMKVKKATPEGVISSIEDNKMMRLTNFRIKCFPRYSVTFDQIYDYILRYIEKSAWMPTMIIFDYLDVLAKETGTTNRIDDVDVKWKKASKLAGELDCLVINADQAVKAARTQYALDQMSTSENKLKDAHLDLRIAINKTEDEKELGVARMGVLFHRHEDFNMKKEVLVTQRLETAQAMLDNARLYTRGKKYRVAKSEF